MARALGGWESIVHRRHCHHCSEEGGVAGGAALKPSLITVEDLSTC